MVESITHQCVLAQEKECLLPIVTWKWSNWNNHLWLFRLPAVTYHSLPKSYGFSLRFYCVTFFLNGAAGFLPHTWFRWKKVLSHAGWRFWVFPCWTVGLIPSLVRIQWISRESQGAHPPREKGSLIKYVFFSSAIIVCSKAGYCLGGDVALGVTPKCVWQQRADENYSINLW